MADGGNDAGWPEGMAARRESGPEQPLVVDVYQWRDVLKLSTYQEEAIA